MLRRRAIVTTLVLLVLGLSRGIAEASRFDFAGNGDDGVIIWDGDFDVSSMQNNCGASLACATSTYTPGLPVAFHLAGSVGADLTFDSLLLVLSVPFAELPANCGIYTCGALDAVFPGHGGSNLNMGNVQNPAQNPVDPEGEGQKGVILLPAFLPNGFGGSVQNGDQFALNPLAAAFLAGLTPVDPWRMGILLNFDQGLNPLTGQHVPFTVTVDQPGVNAVPEPATLALLGTGIATLVARRRRARR